MKNLLLGVVVFLLASSVNVMAQYNQVPGEQFPSPSELLQDMSIASDMNDQYDNLYISKFSENLLEGGGLAALILEYRAPAGLPDLSNIGNLDAAARKGLLDSYKAAMVAASSGLVNQLNVMPNCEVKRAMSYSSHISVFADMAALEAILASNKYLSVVENSLSKPLSNVSNGIVGADVVKAEGMDGTGCSVAVLDTGADPDHVQFNNNKIVASACFNFEFLFAPGFQTLSTCPGGLNVEESLTDGSAAEPCTIPANFGVTDFIDDNRCGRHGNNVSAIAVGNDRGDGVEGIASGASLVSINVFTYFEWIDDVRAFTEDIMLGLEWVLENGSAYNICAVNMSLGGGQAFAPCDTDPRAPIIGMLRDAGIATVISSGNNGFSDSVGAPACIEAAISVGATDDNDNLAAFSNHDADLVDLLAPGVGILAAYGHQDSGDVNWYAGFTGTSMAAPHVAGAFAILKAAFPQASVDQIEAALKTTGVPVAHPVTGEVVPRIQIDAAKAVLTTFYIPTMSQWGLFILAMMLTSLAVVRIRSSQVSKA